MSVVHDDREQPDGDGTGRRQTAEDAEVGEPGPARARRRRHGRRDREEDDGAADRHTLQEIAYVTAKNAATG